MSKDPVCGMEVKNEKYCSAFAGKKYCFCSLACKKTFDNDPEKYAWQEEEKKK